MTADQTNRVCTECDEYILESNYNYDTESGLRSLYCEECGTTKVEEGVGARMDRMARGESLDEIHSNLSEEVRNAIKSSAPPKIEASEVKYVDGEGNENIVDISEDEDEEDPDIDPNDACVFPNCTETEELQFDEGTGWLCDEHYRLITADLNDPEVRREFVREQAKEKDWIAMPPETENQTTSDEE